MSAPTPAERELCERIRVELVSANRALAEASEPRVQVLRRLLRAHVASAVLDDLEGELLTKEVREMCEGDDDRRAIRDELQILIVDILLGRSCCVPSSGGSCPGCGYPRAYVHPDFVDDAFDADAVYVLGTAVQIEAEPSIPRGVVRIVQGAGRGFEYVDYPISQDPGEGKISP